MDFVGNTSNIGLYIRSQGTPYNIIKIQHDIYLNLLFLLRVKRDRFYWRVNETENLFHRGIAAEYDIVLFITSMSLAVRQGHKRTYGLCCVND